MTETDQRTIQQNKSLHLYFEMLADAFNSAGYDMRKVLKPSIAIPWNKESVKEMLWKPIQNIQLGKMSTTQLTTKEIDVIYDTLNRHIGERFGIFVEFPSEESLNQTQ